MSGGFNCPMEEINRKEMYHGHAFDVHQVQLLMPNGQIKNYDLVKHRGAVVIVPLDSTGNLLSARQYRLGAEEELLELPAGVLERGEMPEDCARREIREETGMAAKHWLKLGEYYIAPGYCTEYQHIYLASDLSYDPLEADDDEFIEIVKIPVGEVYKMVKEGKIHDGKTLAALLLAKPELMRQIG